MAAAIDDRRQQHARIPAADIESANAFRAVHFVRGKGSHIHIHFIDVERNLSGRLNRIGVEQDAAFARDLSDFLDVLNDADFVIRGHDRDQDRLVGDRVAKIVEIDKSLVVDRQKRDAATFLFQVLAGIENRLVFGDAGDDVIALFAIHPRHAFERQIVGFGRAAGEDDFPRIGADQKRRFALRASSTAASASHPNW